MPTQTTNLNLEKPLGSEKYNVSKLNANFDKVDANALNKMTYKGEVALLVDLPSANQKVGDYYIVVEKGVPYLWNGTEFKPQVILPDIPEGGETLQSIGTLISSADVKVTPVVDDVFGYADSEDVVNPNILKKLTWGNIRGTLATFFEGIFALVLHGHVVSDVTDLVTTLSGKQPTLVSATNIKTINGKSVLGDGNLSLEEPLWFSLSDEATAITTGTSKLTIRMPFACKLSTTLPRASLNTVSSSGIPTVDINKSGATILTNKLTIDATEKTSVTAATPCSLVNTPTTFTDDEEVTFDIDVAGTGAKGLKVILYVERT